MAQFSREAAKLEASQRLVDESLSPAAWSDRLKVEQARRVSVGALCASAG
jgi:hypothetical protein